MFFTPTLGVILVLCTFLAHFQQCANTDESIAFSMCLLWKALFAENSNQLLITQWKTENHDKSDMRPLKPTFSWQQRVWFFFKKLVGVLVNPVKINVCESTKSKGLLITLSDCSQFSCFQILAILLTETKREKNCVRPWDHKSDHIYLPGNVVI